MRSGSPGTTRASSLRGAKLVGSCLAALMLAGLGSCQSQRLLRVTSEPSQAEVRLDGVRVGTTPCDIPFQHYGVRRLTVYKEDHRTYSRVIEIDPPWYGRFPLDLISEVVLFFWQWDDIHKVHAKLVPGQSVLLEPDFPAVLERAENLRRSGPDGPKPLPVEPPKP
jgi:hypothetical protein